MGKGQAVNVLELPRLQVQHGAFDERSSQINSNK
jgi:hypothetical protein